MLTIHPFTGSSGSEEGKKGTYRRGEGPGRPCGFSSQHPSAGECFSVTIDATFLLSHLHSGSNE